MGKQIVKQPNGLFCIFSSVVDSVIHYDCDQQEIVDIFVQETVDEIKRKVNKIICELNNDEKPYYQFTMTYEDMFKQIKDVHGVEKAIEIRKKIENK